MDKVMYLVACVIVLLSNVAVAAPEITDAELRKSIDELSSSTLVGGEGWTVYEQLLHPQYSRWAMGEIYEGRNKFVKSIEQWWDYGMRVANRDVDVIAIDIVGDIAIIRFKTTESFVGPDGPVEGFSGYVSNTWVREDCKWFLLSAEISSTRRTE
jgi:hypothetical protein